MWESDNQTLIAELLRLRYLEKCADKKKRLNKKDNYCQHRNYLGILDAIHVQRYAYYALVGVYRR